MRSCGNAGSKSKKWDIHAWIYFLEGQFSVVLYDNPVFVRCVVNGYYLRGKDDSEGHDLEHSPMPLRMNHSGIRGIPTGPPVLKYLVPRQATS
jgi:hypothetical protein